MTTEWTTAADIEAQVRRLWDQGRILSARLTCETMFPLKLRFRAPDSRALGEKFAAVRDWIAALEANSRRGFKISWREVNHRQLGRNRVPDGIEILDEAMALGLIGKVREAAAFNCLADTTLGAFPELGDWLARRPLTALGHADDWPRILAVLEWFRRRPRPNLYLRQLDIPGVDTKFIETHKGLLSDLLTLVLPPEAVDTSVTGAKGFEQRFGLLSKPPTVRFRILDPTMALPLNGLTDFTVPAAELAASAPPGRLVFITENEVNGLSFPHISEAIVIFGLGHGIGMLDDFTWLHDREIHYWGDIDTHGFAMLDRLRKSFPHVQSLLMGRDTLLAHRSLWGHEDRQHTGQMENLTDDESILFNDLRLNTISKNIRLEQEQISFAYLIYCLKKITLCPTISHTSPHGVTSAKTPFSRRMKA